MQSSLDPCEPNKSSQSSKKTTSYKTDNAYKIAHINPVLLDEVDAELVGVVTLGVVAEV